MAEQATSSENLRRITVGIQDEKGVMLGTGVILSEQGVVVTCYHVVGGEENGVLAQKFTISFPNAPEVSIPAAVDPQYSKRSLDLAFLKLGAALPKGTSAASLSEKLNAGDDFMSFGFRKAGYFSGLYSRGEILGLVRVRAEDQESLERIQLSTDQIEVGMSGAPILDLRSNSVVGIVSTVFRGNEGEDKSIALGIPSKVILESYPILNSGRSEPGARTEPQVKEEKVSMVRYKVLVAGSRSIETNYDQTSKIARTIGAKIMDEENWILLNNGASLESSGRIVSIARLVCEGALSRLGETGDLKLEKERILTLHYDKPDHPLHDRGKVEIAGTAASERRRALVERADAIITIEGGSGTKDIINNALKSKKPVLPIACTGRKSKKAWNDNEEEILQTFGIKKPSKEYDMLTTTLGLNNPAELADLVINMIKDKIIQDKLFRSMHDTPTHADNPSKKDLLGRKPFAKAIASGIEYYLGKSGNTGSFLVHIYGAWGSGKSTLLGFLEAELKPKWVVVSFNAWQNQRIGPPWWSLMDAVYRGIVQNTPFPFSWGIRIKENMWRLWNGWSKSFWFAALSSAAIAIAIFGAILSGYIPTEPVQNATQGSTQNATSPGGLELLTLFSGIIATIVSVATGIRALGNSLLPGSTSAASQFLAKTADPMQKLQRHFQTMMGWTGKKPVAIFVDDLDRCKDEYTVEFLEGVQTIFRHADNLVFVIAADRRWLYSSYQKVYGSFSEAFDELGRPLGYLFLDKTFQISVAMPKLSGRYQEDYLNYLVTLDEKAFGEFKEEAKVKAERQAETLNGSAIENRLKSTEDGTVEDHSFPEAVREALADQAFREAVVEHVFARPEFKEKTENFLREFSRFMEPNPRSMKRLVTAFGLWRARDVLSGSYIDDDKLARWVIISQRWPMVANFLEEHPEVADIIANFLEEHPEVADPVNGKGREDLDNKLKESGVEEEAIRKMLSNVTIINVMLGKDVGKALKGDTVRKVASQ